MKISVNDIELFTLNETQKLVIQSELSSEIFEEDMKRRLQWVLIHKYEQCFNALKRRWDPILSQRYTSIPTDSREYSQLVFSQPDYKDAATLIAEENQ